MISIDSLDMLNNITLSWLFKKRIPNNENKTYIFFSILLLFIACKSYTPFSSFKIKKEQLSLIKNKFNLTKDEFKKIKNEDSIIFAVAKSLKKNIKLKLTERRLDSFFVSNYD